jgi:condensin complex subunit 2
VDPLFKKTKEDFDEGGAMGLLLNHLSVDGKGRLVFDAGDATVGDDEEELDPRDEEMVDLAGLMRTSSPSTQSDLELTIRVHSTDEKASRTQYLRFPRIIQILFRPE